MWRGDLFWNHHRVAPWAKLAFCSRGLFWKLWKIWANFGQKVAPQMIQSVLKYALDCSPWSKFWKRESKSKFKQRLIFESSCQSPICLENVGGPIKPTLFLSETKCKLITFEHILSEHFIWVNFRGGGGVPCSMPLKFQARLSGEKDRWVLWEAVYLNQGRRDLWRGKHKDIERYRFVYIYSYIRIFIEWEGAAERYWERNNARRWAGKRVNEREGVKKKRRKGREKRKANERKGEKRSEDCSEKEDW